MRKIKQALVNIIDLKLRDHGAAQEAIRNKDARSLLVYAAEACVGEKEEGKDNHGTFVELCQHTVDNIAQGESWCMAFVESMVAYVEFKLGIRSPLYSAENCLSVWENTPDSQIVKNLPLKGAIVIWRHTKASSKTFKPSGSGKRSFFYQGSGHTGFVMEYDYNDSEPKMTTIEGNTNAAGSSNGDGVFMKRRYKQHETGNSDLEVVGFLIPFAN